MDARWACVHNKSYSLTTGFVAHVSIYCSFQEALFAGVQGVVDGVPAWDEWWMMMWKRGPAMTYPREDIRGANEHNNKQFKYWNCMQDCRKQFVLIYKLHVLSAVWNP